MRVLETAIARAVPLVALVIGLSCCGSGAADGSDAASAVHGQVPAAGALGARAEKSKGLPASGGCGAARVHLGRFPGAIEFTLKCRPYRDGGKVHFAVGLTPASPGSGVEIDDFRRHPQVREAGSMSRRATCLQYGGGLSCFARAQVTIRLSGRVWVKRGSECDAKVLISESRAGRPCTAVCESSAPAAVIFEGRPRGC
jgi:hypothetical protein